MNDGAEPTEPTSGFIDDGSRVAGFLDLPGQDVAAVTSAIFDGFSRLDDDGVLTVFCRRIDPEAISTICALGCLELVHSVVHGSGTSFVLQRANRIQAP
jgi:hypothetical protein